MPRRQPQTLCFFMIPVVILLLFGCNGGNGTTTGNGGSGGSAPPPPSGQSVLTYHDNIQRTGLNDHETTLTPSNVNSSSFGLIHNLKVDGKVDAQPPPSVPTDPPTASSGPAPTPRLPSSMPTTRAVSRNSTTATRRPTGETISATAISSSRR